MNIKLNEEIFEGKYLKDKYSKYAKEEEKIEGVPYINFPFSVEGLPSEWKYLSWAFIDHDSNPVVQFSWIHWLAANYNTQENTTNIAENLVETSASYIGGVNTYASPLANIKSEKIILNYGAPAPPDKDHEYTLYVYAHKEPLNLQKGFYYNELNKELEHKECLKTEITILARS